MLWASSILMSKKWKRKLVVRTVCVRHPEKTWVIVDHLAETKLELMTGTGTIIKSSRFVSAGSIS